MRTVDRVLAFVCAVTAVFAPAFAVGRIVGPDGSPGDPPVGEHSGTDGVVVRGTSALDVSVLTGEALPVDVAQETRWPFR
jgi:hypothetical protein